MCSGTADAPAPVTAPPSATIEARKRVTALGGFSSCSTADSRGTSSRRATSRVIARSWKPTPRRSATAGATRLPPVPNAAEIVTTGAAMSLRHGLVGRRLHPLAPLDELVRVEDELLGHAGVEVLVGLRRLVERDHRGVHGLGDLHAVVEDRLHEPAVVAHDRALARHQRVRLGPAQADAH